IHLFLSEYQWVATCLLVLGIVITTSLFLSTILKETINMQQWNLFSSSMLYIVMPIILLLYLRSLSLSIPLALILMIWMNDTMAYLVGSFIGKTPFSKISPKKTWEGTLGGVLLTLIGAAIWGYYAPYYRMIDWMALALCAAIAGTMGDLLESKLKRLAGLKDSGTMMPGHGGALDRFDSLLVATPFAFGYAYIFMPPLPLVVF
nr:phosphatidate cytidylyltransferase [Flavipsychrobacter sp.]